MKKNFATQLFLWSHRWFGIVIGVYFVLFGLSGSYLVYEHFFESTLYSERYRSEGTAEQIDLPSIVRSAMQGLNTEKTPLRVILPESKSENATVVFNMAEDGPPKLKTAYVDASNGSFKGAFERTDSIGGVLFTFHHDMFLGAQKGRVWMGIAGVLCVILLLSGLWLWWPKSAWIRLLKWPKLRSLYKASLDLHKLFGFYTLVLMFAVTFSGLYISVPGWFQFGGEKSAPRGGGGGSPQVNIPAIDYAEIQTSLANQGLLQRPLAVMWNNREKAILVRLSEDKPVYVFDSAARSLTAKPKDVDEGFDMRRFQREIHEGDYWGKVGEILTFLSGLLPLFFYVTGFYVWWKKRKIVSLSH